MAALANPFAAGLDVLLRTKKDHIAIAAAAVDDTMAQVVDSRSYWEWHSEPDNTLFSAAHITSNLLLLIKQRDLCISTTESRYVVNAAVHDAYWAESRFPSERKQQDDVSESSIVETSSDAAINPAATAPPPYYWDEARFAPTQSDAYWQW